MLDTLLLSLTKFANAEEASGLGALGIDPVAIAAQASTFLILFLLAKKFAFKPISNTLEKRQTTIEQSIKEAEDLIEANKRTDAKIAEALKTARVESDKILKDAHAEATSIAKEAEVKAKASAEKIIEGAEAEIKLSVEKAKTELKSEVMGLVAQATESIIKQKMNDSSDKKIVEDILSNQ